MQDKEAMGKSLDLYGDEIVIMTRQKQVNDYISFMKNPGNKDLLYWIGKDEFEHVDNLVDGRSDEEYRDELMVGISYYIDTCWWGSTSEIKCGSCGKCNTCEEDAGYQQLVDHILILQSRNPSWEDDWPVYWMDENCGSFKALQDMHPRIKI